jgi:hypothetical protein
VFSLRIREELRRRLVQEAKKQERSLNTEIIQRLEHSLKAEDEAQGIARLEDWLVRIVGDPKVPFVVDRGALDRGRHDMDPRSWEGLYNDPGSLVGLAALGGPLGRIAAIAALQTEAGRAAALEALRAQQKLTQSAGGKT